MEEFTPPSRPSRLPPPAGPRTGPQEGRRQNPFRPPPAEKGESPPVRGLSPPLLTPSRHTFSSRIAIICPGPGRSASPSAAAAAPHCPAAARHRAAPAAVTCGPASALPRGRADSAASRYRGLPLGLRAQKGGERPTLFLHGPSVNHPCLIQSAPGLRPTHRKVTMNTSLQLVSRSVL